MKLKNLRKKIWRLEKRLQEGPKKLAKLRQKLQATEAAKAMKAARKSAARARATLQSSAQTADANKRGTVKKAKRKLNLSPERRAQLSAAMKARWAAKRAADATATTVSTGQDFSVEPTTQAPENRSGGV
jgi:hypothetical protein